MDSLTQSNKGLIIQNESVECDVVNRDKLIEDVKVELGMVCRDLDWLLHFDVVSVMDTLIMHPKFISGVRQIHRATFVAREEAGRAGLKDDIDA